MSSLVNARLTTRVMAWSLARDPVSVLTLVLVGFMVAMPVSFLVYASLLSQPPGAAGAHLTLENWALLTRPEHLRAIGNTLQLAFWVTVASVVIGGCLGWLVTRTDMPVRGPITLALVLPVLLSPLLTALAWTVLASPRSGLINVAFHAIVPVEWPLLDIFSMFGMVLVMTLYFVPFVYLVTVGALRGIDSSTEDASRIAGAGVITTLRRVTLPMITPALLSSAMLVFALAAEQLAVPTLLGLEAKVPTLQYEIYVAMIESPGSPTYAATAGTLLMLIAVIGIFVYRRGVGVSRRFVTVSGKATAPKIVRLGALRYPALGLALLYLTAAVVAPYGALLLGSFLKYVSPDLSADSFTLANYQKLSASRSSLAALQNTLVFGVIAASLTVLFGFVIGYLVARRPGKLGRALEIVAALPLSLPAISLGLGLLWAYLFIPIGIYGTAAMLVIAYVTRFTSQSLRTVSASLLQVDPDLELAARIHGASALGAVWSVTRPLLAPAIMAAWVLVFVQTILELSMTIMLYTPRTATAALSIWFAYFGGDTVLAYTLGVIMATIAFVLIFVGQRTFGLLRHIP